MKVSSALKLVLGVLFVMLVTIFVLQNRGPVRVALPFERSFSFGLIYLLLISYFLGVATFAVTAVTLRVKNEKKRKVQEQEEAEELLDEE